MTSLRPLPDRNARLAALEERPPRVAIVGGGITGVGLAHDLALRGIEVAIFERGDWASATSSASSRLIHGGLRYLEQFEFALVRDSCLERGLLLSNAAGIVWPERFTFPVHAGDRVGRAKLLAGLSLYTLVSFPRVLGLPALHGRATVARRIPGSDTNGLRGGGSYLDGATDDSRLALAVVASAIEAGATALSRTEVVGIEDGVSGVELRWRDLLDGNEGRLHADAVVLAGGPFTESLRSTAKLDGRWVSPTRGTHVLVPRERLPTDGAVIFPSPVDGRIMFLIPWPRYTVIGTTDLDADPGAEVRATRAEVHYLLDSANGLVPDAALSDDDVVGSWAGLRPLLAADDENPSARTREERVARDGHIYTIAGGKLTGYRSMAEKLGARLARDLGYGNASKHSPTRTTKLRGALPRPVARPAWSALPAPSELQAHDVAWQRRYAGLASEVAEFCGRVEQGRRALDAETLLGEVDWAVSYEDCLTAEDFCFRRTDLGLGPRAGAEAAAASVLERLAATLAWNGEQRTRERERLEAALARCHAWRRDP